VRNLVRKLLDRLALKAVGDLLEQDHRAPRVLRGLEESPAKLKPEREVRDRLGRSAEQFLGNGSVVQQESAVEASHFAARGPVRTPAKDFARVAVRAALKGSPGSSSVASLLNAPG
jgi:hypothetical protein